MDLTSEPLDPSAVPAGGGRILRRDVGGLVELVLCLGCSYAIQAVHCFNVCDGRFAFRVVVTDRLPDTPDRDD